LVGKKIFL